jgi:hypothetical protein
MYTEPPIRWVPGALSQGVELSKHVTGHSLRMHGARSPLNRKISRPGADLSTSIILLLFYSQIKHGRVYGLDILGSE